MALGIAMLFDSWSVLQFSPDRNITIIIWTAVQLTFMFLHSWSLEDEPQLYDNSMLSYNVSNLHKYSVLDSGLIL